jgi:hypothetical protein
MNIKDIFTADELALIDSGNYKPGRAVLDAKLDLVAAEEREACARMVEDKFDFVGDELIIADAIRARGNT